MSVKYTNNNKKYIKNFNIKDCDNEKLTKKKFMLIYVQVHCECNWMILNKKK